MNGVSKKSTEATGTTTSGESRKVATARSGPATPSAVQVAIAINHGRPDAPSLECRMAETARAPVTATMTSTESGSNSDSGMNQSQAPPLHPPAAILTTWYDAKRTSVNAALSRTPTAYRGGFQLSVAVSHSCRRTVVPCGVVWIWTRSHRSWSLSAGSTTLMASPAECPSVMNGIAAARNSSRFDYGIASWVNE